MNDYATMITVIVYGLPAAAIAAIVLVWLLRRGRK